MKIILKRDIDSIVKKDWKFLEKKNNLILFQTLKWNENWLKFNKTKNSIFIFIIYKNNKPFSIFPFYLQKKFSFRIIKWFGFDISDYLGPIFDNSYEVKHKEIIEIWNNISSSLKPECDLIYLDKQTDEKSIINNPLCNYLNLITYKQNLRIDLSKWELTKKKKNKSFQQFRRKKKKLLSLGIFELLFDIQSIETKKNLISEMIKWKKFSKKKFVFANSFNKDFYSEILDNKGIHLSALKINGSFVAAILGYKYLNNFFFLVPSFKEENRYFKYSPGRILLIELINHIQLQKFKNFDFCDGDQDYKSEWTNQKIDIKVFLKSNTIKGKLLKLYMRIFNL